MPIIRKRQPFIAGTVLPVTPPQQRPLVAVVSQASQSVGEFRLGEGVVITSANRVSHGPVPTPERAFVTLAAESPAPSVEDFGLGDGRVIVSANRAPPPVVAIAPRAFITSLPQPPTVVNFGMDAGWHMRAFLYSSPPMFPPPLAARQVQPSPSIAEYRLGEGVVITSANRAPPPVVAIPYRSFITVVPPTPPPSVEDFGLGEGRVQVSYNQAPPPPTSLNLYSWAENPSFNPTNPRGSWTSSTPFRRRASHSKLAGGSTTGTGLSITGSSDAEIFRTISDPLPTQTISGTLDVIIQVGNNNLVNSPTVKLKLHVYVSVGSTNAVRGTLLSNYIDPTPVPFSSKIAVEFTSPQTLTPVSIQDGDRIVAELGVSVVGTGTNSVLLYYGTQSATNGPAAPDATSGSTGIVAGFLKFSPGLALQDKQPPTPAVLGQRVDYDQLNLGDGRVISSASQAPPVPPPQPYPELPTIVVGIDAPPHPGWVLAESGEPPTPPPIPRSPSPRLVAGIDQPPHPGAVLASSALPSSTPPFGLRPPWKMVLAEPPRPDPGWYFTYRFPPLVTTITPPGPSIVRTEPPPSFPGWVFESSAPTPPPTAQAKTPLPRLVVQGEYRPEDGVVRSSSPNASGRVLVAVPRAILVYAEPPLPEDVREQNKRRQFARNPFKPIAGILRRAEDIEVIEITPGAVSQSRDVFIRDSNTGQGKTGLSASSLGATVAYRRTGGTAVSVPLVALSTPGDAWTSGGFIENNSSLMPGWYRIDFPNAALAAGVPEAVFEFSFDVSLNVLQEPLRILLRSPTSNTGPGGIAFTVTVTDNTSAPLANAECWVTSDAAGTFVVAGTLTSDDLGQVVFYLDPGQYFLWITHPGFTGTNPTPITVM